ncbi:MAG: hypothetical protein HN356_07540 [Calditrichaeota bacterium]|nr:hypothetical protein [Calditrichota bacterium]MBT7617085.1 hypothetical protein [Calditrichota bacterium]
MTKYLLPVLMFLIIGMAFVAGCSLDIENVGAPVWDIELTIPFSEKVYRLGELTNDQSEFDENGWAIFEDSTSSELRFEYKDEIEPQIIAERLRVDQSSRGNYTNQIGLISIEEPPLENSSIIIEQLSDDFETGGEYPLIPAFDFGGVEDSLSFEVFQWVNIQEGTLTMTVSNTFPFDIVNLQISLSTIVNRGGQRVREAIGTVSYDQPIQTGNSESRDIDLSGQQIHSEILVQIQGQVPFTPGPITMSDGSNLKIDIGISSTLVTAAKAEVDRQDFDSPHSIPSDEDITIVSAEIKSGMAHLRLTNTTGFRIFVDMIFDNIILPDGSPDSLHFVIDPNSTSENEIELSGKAFNMPLDDQQFKVRNHVATENTRVTYQNPEDQAVEISSNQGVEIEYWTDEMFFSSLEGALVKEEFDMGTQDIDVEIPEGLDNINFEQANVRVDLLNDIGVSVQLDLQIISSNDTQTEVLDTSFAFTPGDRTIEILGIDRLIEIIPTRIQSTGSVKVGSYYFPDAGLMMINEDQGFSGDLLLMSDLKFSLDGTSMTTDPISLSEEFDYPLENVSMRVIVENSVPLSGQVKLLMGNNLESMDTILTASLPQAEILNHRVREAARSELIFELTPDQLDIMKLLPLYTQQVLVLNSTGGEFVHLYAEDSVSVQASATVRYLIDAEEEDD